MMTEEQDLPENGQNSKSSDNRPIHLKSPKEVLRPVRPPAAPRRSRHARNPWVIAFNLIFSVAILGILAAGGFFFWGSQNYVAKGPLEKTTRVIINRGANVRTIGDILSRNQIIESPLFFWASVRVQKKENQLKAGEYLFEKGASMEDVVNKLVEGKAVIHKVTIPEGRTSQQIVEILRENEILTGEIKDIPEEGALLPNTYTFDRGTSRGEILDRMKADQKKALDRIWENRVKDLPLKTPEELVILASIVEKETGQADERSRVAGVFINRLRQGIRLQSDPTIIYGLFGGRGKPSDRPIYKSDITKKTDYNTYVIKALPPGPIANPGLAAMEAVANPSVTKDLYFVADGTGGHAFAETLEDHNRNVKRWRQIEKERLEKEGKENKEKKDDTKG